jgi:anti-anti-sigma factor
MEPDDGITVNGNTLRVSGELGPDNESPFDEATQKLLASRDNPLVVDLSDAHYVASSYVRHIATLAVEANRHGLRVVLVAERRTIRMLELAGLDKLGNVELVRAD